LAPYLSQVRHDKVIFSPAIAIRERNAIRAANRKTKHTPSSLARQSTHRKCRETYNACNYRRAIVYALNALEKANKKVDPEALVARWHPHQLRHSRATETRSRYGVEGAQAQLGNTLEATEIYAEKSVALAVRIALETG
jgi:integrase